MSEARHRANVAESLVEDPAEAPEEERAPFLESTLPRAGEE